VVLSLAFSPEEELSVWRAGVNNGASRIEDIPQDIGSDRLSVGSTARNWDGQRDECHSHHRVHLPPKCPKHNDSFLIASKDLPVDRLGRGVAEFR
jgi:hypothetical protein